MNGSEAYVLGIDIGGTNMRFGLVDGSHRLSAFERQSTRDTFLEDCDPAQKLAACIRGYCGRNLGGKMPKAVSIGFPSTINRARTVVVQTPNIACIPDDFAVVDALESALGIPVFINRDVNYLLLFDLEDLGVTAQDCVAGIYFGTGIGQRRDGQRKDSAGPQRRRRGARAPARLRQQAGVHVRQCELYGDGRLGHRARTDPGAAFPRHPDQPAFRPAHGLLRHAGLPRGHGTGGRGGGQPL